MKLHYWLILAAVASLTVSVGCERKDDPAKPDAGATNGSPATGADAGVAAPEDDVAPYIYSAHVDDAGKPKFTNQAAKSANSWIARHGHQPIHWNTWTSRPLTLAKSQAKPVFLVIGDIGCSPCAQRSGTLLDSAKVGAVVNEHFIPTIVDGGERPDIAHFVRESVSVLSGAAPPLLMVAMTAGGHVVLDASGAADDATLAKTLDEWVKDYPKRMADLEKQGKETTARVRKRQIDLAGSAPKPKPLMAPIPAGLQQSFDGENAGWPVGAAKTASPQLVRFVLRAAQWSDDKDSTIAMATKTLDKVASALAHEPGFVTSTASADWKVDHKVKSLADNALLLRAFAEAWQLTKNEAYKTAAESAAALILGDLQAPDGGFYAHAVVGPDGKTRIDRRILSDANGLAMSSLSHAGRVFSKPAWVMAAVSAAAALPMSGGRLVHSSANGTASKDVYATDFALAIDGLLSLFEARPDSSYLRRAVLLQNQMDTFHWDAEKGGYFHVPVAAAAELPVRMKIVRDSTVPSANSTAVLNSIRLEVLRGDKQIATKRAELLGAFGAALKAEPTGSPTMLNALDWLAADTVRVAVVGNKPEALLEVLSSTFLPHHVFATVAKNTLVPWLGGLEPRAGKPTGYVCRAECSDAITEPAEFEKALRAP